MPPTETKPGDLVRLSEVARETALSSTAERIATSLMERLMQVPDGAAIFKRRAEMIEACYLAALKRTRPQDWVLFRDQGGSENAMLTASGAPLVAELYGIVIQNLRPMDDRGMFAPERIDYENGAYAYRGVCDAWSRFNGRSIEGIEAARRSDEDFTGRSIDAKGNLAKRRPDDGEALDTDLRSSVLTLLQTKAVRVLAGMTRVPVVELGKAWTGTDKTVAECRKGSGFGSSSERGAQAVAPETVKANADELQKEIMRRVGGDESAARDLLEEITSWTNKEGKLIKGARTTARLTQQFQIDNARKKLEAHPTFGNNAQGKGGNGDEREPGEDRDA